MKTDNSFFTLENSSLDRYELSAIRGGTNTGGSTPVYEDILLPDPEPEEED